MTTPTTVYTGRATNWPVLAVAVTLAGNEPDVALAVLNQAIRARGEHDPT